VRCPNHRETLNFDPLEQFVRWLSSQACDDRPENLAAAARLGGTVRIVTFWFVGSGAVCAVIESGRTNVTVYPPSWASSNPSQFRTTV
jgi:hypothetical protein